MSANLRRRLVVFIVVVIAVVAFKHFREAPTRRPTGPGTPAKADVLHIGTLTLNACAIGNRVDEGAATISAYCNDFSVPEDWSAPEGRHITLKVAVLRADTDKPRTDLVTFLDGGPGGAATEDYASVENGFNQLRESRNILLVDQRGTGGSNALNCIDKKEDSQKLLAQEADASEASQIDSIKACLTKLAPRANPQFYGTADAAQDLEAVRIALGGPQLDLVGISYGTRMAQQYAGRYPSAVRSIVLDSTVPNRLVLLSEHARNLENALKAEFALCTRDPLCAKTYGDPYATLYRVRSALKAHPQTIDIRDPVSFAPLHLTLTADDLATVVRFYAYSPLTAALLPLMLQQADQGNFAPLLGQKKYVADDLADHLTSGVGASIICAEDADLLVANPADEDTIMGNAAIERTKKLCQLWPHGIRAANYHEPLVSAVPTLVLAGELDPVTPPAYGAEVVRSLSHARLLTVVGQGHSVIGVGCMPRLVSRFIDTLDEKAITGECLEKLGQTPAFINYNGAAP